MKKIMENEKILVKIFYESVFSLKVGEYFNWFFIGIKYFDENGKMFIDFHIPTSEFFDINTGITYMIMSLHENEKPNANETKNPNIEKKEHKYFTISEDDIIENKNIKFNPILCEYYTFLIPKSSLVKKKECCNFLNYAIKEYDAISKKFYEKDLFPSLSNLIQLKIKSQKTTNKEKKNNICFYIYTLLLLYFQK